MMFKKLILSICSAALLYSTTAMAYRVPITTLHVSNGQEIISQKAGQTIFTKIAIRPYPQTRTVERAPLNLTLVIDVSGSMSIADRMPNAKKAAVSLVESLTEKDSLSLVVFSSSAKLLVPPQKLTDKKVFLNAISRIQPQGNTALYAGVDLGSKQLQELKTGNSVSRIILLSDGEANVGPSSPAQLAALGSTLAKQNISVSTIGLGLGYNAELMQRLAAASDGNHVFVENAQGLETVFQQEFNDAGSVVARNAKIEVEFDNNITPVRIYGYEGTITGQKVVVDIAQLSSEQEKYIIIESVINKAPNTVALRVATVTSSYTLLSDNRVIEEKAQSMVTTSADEQAAEKSYNAGVMEHVVLQQATARNAEALKAIQQGETAVAAEILQANKDKVAEDAKQYGVAPAAAAPLMDSISNYETEISQGSVETLEKQMNQDVYNSSRQKAYQ